MSTNADEIIEIPFSTNNEVVGSAPAVSIGTYMLSISSALSRSSIDSAHQQQVNNMASLLVAIQGVSALLALKSESRDIQELVDTIHQMSSGE